MKVKAINWDLRVIFDWKCPNCNKLNHVEYTPSPYETIADNLGEEYSCDCGMICEPTMYNIDEDED